MASWSAKAADANHTRQWGARPCASIKTRSKNPWKDTPKQPPPGPRWLSSDDSEYEEEEWPSLDREHKTKARGESRSRSRTRTSNPANPKMSKKASRSQSRSRSSTGGEDMDIPRPKPHYPQLNPKPRAPGNESENTDHTKAIEDMVTDLFCMDLGRMRMLLAATAEARSSNAPDYLPSCFLNPNVAQELGYRSPPGPCILKENGNFKIACKENIVVLPPASSPEKTVLLTVYFILNLSYPYIFGQFLGLVQAVVKGEPFEG
ncbi:hypothetical protein HPB49_019070 [Dermacentor silvarum]|uniref:Uncharacterized protein n=1 Tax=Dermacentor silvarum TaxID=543639 RepID=A0ACB8C508_DERSI|nr:hypothetical protein HPB49_019070 [Dermacentor silvarum]